ncbi:MAG TPA: DUF1318 domain-containing protein [Desulfobulbaceae bacterium]|nr:DUF1318 domain-containing protein [Desulfobulbaceae bacterium]
MKKTILFLLTTLFLFCQTGFALDLGAAKAQGLVGETVTGYLAPVKATPEVQKLVNSINAKRKAMYAKIAKRNGTSLPAVEQLAGKKAIEKTPPGQFINLGKGWQKK